MSSEDNKMLEFNQCQKSDKTPFIFYAHLEWIIEKTDECKTSPENSFKTKVNKHIPSCFSMSTISSFRSIENKQKHGIYRGKGCIKKFCIYLREHAMKMIVLKRKNWNC